MRDRIILAFTLLLSFSIVQAQTPCESGYAGIYPCNNVDLLSIVPSSTFGSNIEMNDIWGWTDALDGKEYVLLGMTNGTSFFDISDPVNPVYLGILPTQTSNSIWRDIKVFNDYAFIVSEAGGHGMQVFDLTRLRSVAAPPETFTVDAHYNLFGSSHNIAINEATGHGYAVGTSLASGGLHIINLNNPLSPTFIGEYALDGYTHDAQVVTYTGPDTDYSGSEIAFNSNEDALTIADVTDPTDAQTVSVSTYGTASYSHQGWLTPDQRYFLLGDELDEYYGAVSNTTTYIWDVQDLDAPVLIGSFVSSTTAIDHNLYTDGNLCYQSNYRGGLRILDLTNVASASLSEVAFFDLYPSSDAPQFNGTWSNYPYFESGVVAVSHIEDGMFLLKPRFVDVSIADDFICYTDDAVFDVEVMAGFVGAVNLQVVSGLPAGATATFSNNNVGPGVYTLTLSNLPAAGGTFNLVVSGTGDFFTYEDSINFTVYDCVNEILGCTDPAASNYDSTATIDDGSCIYPCYDITIEILTDCWGSEVSWDVVDALGNTVAAGPTTTYGNQTTYFENLCLPAGCYDFTMYDSFGDGLDGTTSGCAIDGNYQVYDGSGNILAVMAVPNYGSSVTHNFCIPVGTPGCMDTSACNYDSAATVDDGSCDYSCYGCTDSGACNFDSAATNDDGSCEYLTCAGCTNSGACNYDSTATIDDGSCEFTSCAGCTDSGACNYDSTATIDDGSCEFTSCAGCTDSGACNYSSTATIDDGLCEYISCAGCTDSNACNYNAAATIDDGSCIAPTTWYADNDNDGFGDDLITLLSCDAVVPGYVLDNTDCDDMNDTVYPGAPGTGEGIDNNCNGTLDGDEFLNVPCPGDYNNDGIRSTPDLLMLLGGFGCLSDCAEIDLTNDDMVTTEDLLIFLGLFGQLCP
ncbi:MAG: choice-of-anchor B family protein [Flavobacteriales bacterium]|nr:choice-of-anchor B family protein [Flavobacteriales bacterium]